MSNPTSILTSIPKKRGIRFRPRFTLAALLVLITVVAIPLAYVAQRRAWNLRRKAARRQLGEMGFQLVPGKPVDRSKLSSLYGFWVDLLLEDSESVSHIAETHLEGDRPESQLSSDLSGLGYFPEIAQLRIENRPTVTDESLAVLRYLPRLQYLEVSQLPKVNGRFLVDLPHPEEMLRLHFGHLHAMNAPEVRTIGRMNKLTKLELVDCPLLTDALLSDVNLPPQLKVLYVLRCDLGDATLGRWLAQCKVKDLSIRANISRNIGPQLAQQTELTQLGIANAPFLDEDFAFLADCKELCVLHLCGVPIEGRIVSSLSALSLAVLELPSTLFREDQLANLGRFTNLKKLDLSWTPITGEGLRPYSSWNKLDQFSLAGTRFSENGKRRLSELELPDCSVFLPSNWTFHDLNRYASKHFQWLWLDEEQAKIQKKETGSSQSYPTRMFSLRQEPLDNFPRELMAPVLKLHQLASAGGELDKTARQEQ